MIATFIYYRKHSNYSINYPENMLMSLGNSTNLDFIHCSSNYIKQIYGLI